MHNVSLVRSVRPEILDVLHQESPAALASRNDLHIINNFLGTNKWFRKTLHEIYRPGDRVLEIGAGIGELSRELSINASVLAGLDLNGRPRQWPRQAVWYKTNVFDFTRWADYPVIIGNLVFHHFDHAGLARLGAWFNEHTRVLITSDPLRRRRTNLLFALLCPLIRAHPVTRYDGKMSVAAGFMSEELPNLLHLNRAIWNWRVVETCFGAYRLVAVKNL